VDAAQSSSLEYREPWRGAWTKLYSFPLQENSPHTSGLRFGARYRHAPVFFSVRSYSKNSSLSGLPPPSALWRPFFPPHTTIEKTAYKNTSTFASQYSIPFPPSRYRLAYPHLRAASVLFPRDVLAFPTHHALNSAELCWLPFFGGDSGYRRHFPCVRLQFQNPFIA